MVRLLSLALALPALTLAQVTTNYYGCYTEGSNNIRALAAASTSDFTTMSEAVCKAFCTTGGNAYSLWATEYGGECYCADSLSQGSFPTFATDCSVDCPGQVGEKCGGGNRLSLYGSSATPPAVTYNPYPPPAVSTIQAVACYEEPVGGRALSGDMTSSNSMTPEACGSYCLNRGFKKFGLEFERECWCDNVVNGTVSTAVPSECYMNCTGDATQICGGPDRLSVWEWV
ncbi:putative fungistatic metabolite [Podospora aff. communis PSN243]|uniref:Fungistatic metabolite n=1 Tax=Podospora aff. communis PSN243 TaxID=3040156 RepID=A0AAV9GA51_9PEZI|nr:putative fungistatic metabolite [Podospora aff. communis PSN243]